MHRRNPVGEHLSVASPRRLTPNFIDGKDAELRSARSATWARHVLLLLAMAGLASLLAISRRPDAFTNPQFYAEDGARWFSDAYNLGPWHALWTVYAGHLLLQPRLVAVIALPFGTGNAPLIYNIFGLLFQIAPALFFMSRRFQSVVPSFWARAALSAVYLLMPSTELNVTDACAQFHLAILATLVIIAPQPRLRSWAVFDIVAVALCAMTGAFAFVLLPVAIVWWWLRRQRWTVILSALLVAGVAAQSYAMVLAPRGMAGLGANLHDLLLIIADRFVLAGLFAEEGHTHVFVAGLPHATLIAGGICLLALAVVVFAALRAPWELRAFALAAVGFAVAGLAVPLVSASGNQWAIMADTRAGERYFLMVQVAWVVTLVWAASQLRARWARRGGWVLTAAAFASGLVAMWTYPAFPDDHWAQEARAITSSKPGTHLTLPIPPEPPWSVDVTVR